MDIEPGIYKEIEDMIGSDASPVGIDAKKTHIYIIHKLHQLEEKLNTLEERINKDKAAS